MFFVLALSLTSCAHPDRRYESTLQLIHRHDVEFNDKGEVTQVDFQMEWDPCPGDQFQFVRGGKEFAACMGKYEPGDYVSVRLLQTWDPDGFYRWDVYNVGGCDREIEPRSPGSFELSQECSDVTIYGVASGFSCLRRPAKKLIEVCPWMARR